MIGRNLSFSFCGISTIRNSFQSCGMQCVEKHSFNAWSRSVLKLSGAFFIILLVIWSSPGVECGLQETIAISSSSRVNGWSRSIRELRFEQLMGRILQ